MGQQNGDAIREVAALARKQPLVQDVMDLGDRVTKLVTSVDGTSKEAEYKKPRPARRHTVATLDSLTELVTSEHADRFPVVVFVGSTGRCFGSWAVSTSGRCGGCW
jgi:hypothetical protein